MIRPIARNLSVSGTFIGLLAACVTAATVPHWWSVAPLLLSLLLGGVDERAVSRRLVTDQLRSTLAAMADRISEVLWAVAFYRLGAPAASVLAFASLAAFQEYAKVRLASIGIGKTRLISMADRNVRGGSLFIAILLYQFAPAHTWVTGLAVAMTIVQAVSFIFLLRFAYKQLH